MHFSHQKWLGNNKARANSHKSLPILKQKQIWKLWKNKSSSPLKHVVLTKKNEKLQSFLEFLVMKAWQTPLKKTPNKMGKKKQKERTKVQTRKTNPKWVIKWQRNKSCSKAPTSCKKYIKKKKTRWETWKSGKPTKAPPKMTTHFKIKVTWSSLQGYCHLLPNKKHAKQLKEGHQCPLLTTWC
jgi:hypothetical protein